MDYHSNSLVAQKESIILNYRVDQNRTLCDVDNGLLNNTLNSQQLTFEANRSSVLSPSCQAKEPDSSPESARDELLYTCMNEAVLIHTE